MLEAIGIHKMFNHATKSLHVLKGLDFKIDQGEVVAIVGPSGAGKSTFLHILGCLDLPSDGQVLLNGEDVYALNDRKRAKIRNEQFGFVFQFYHLLAEFSALENVILPLGVNSGNIQLTDFEEKGKEILNRVGLKDRFDHKPNQLSGGEQQRVAIARALINEPQIILCDEPTGNLDSETGGEIIDLLMNLNKENKQTLVIVTHDSHIAQMSHRSIRMCDGILQTEKMQP